MGKPLNTVVETPAYLAAARDAGMTEVERSAAVDMIAADPQVGDLMVGTGGCRKVRLAGRGKGKSGGYRLITYFGPANAPAFLLTVFSKGDRANVTPAQRTQLAKLTATLLESLT